MRPTGRTCLHFPTAPTEVAPSTSGTISGPSPQQQSEQSYQHLAQRAAPPPNLRGLQLVHVGVTLAPTKPANPTPAQLQMQATMEAYAGPYDVPGEPAPVRAQVFFHSNHRESAQAGGASKKFVEGLVAKLKLSHLVLVGRGSAAAVRQLTQALIDAGKLPPPPGATADRIRRMQAEFGIGMDCAGYVMANVERGGHVKGNRGNSCSSFLGEAIKAGQFRRAPGGLSAMAEAKPGDVLHLAPDNDGREHNVAIFSRETLAAADPRRTLVAGLRADADSTGEVKALLDGPLEMFEIHCSGGGDVERGVRKEYWFHNPATDTWGVMIPGQKDILVSPHGPGNHPSGTLYSKKGA